MNREEWLTRCADLLRPHMARAGAQVPAQVRFTCGWPSHRAISRNKRVIGECWSPDASKDKTTEIFISPCLGDAGEAAAVLVHELIHASGLKGHRKNFQKVAALAGLVAPWTATKPSPQLAKRLNVLIKNIGPYPHAALDKTQAPYKKDTARLLKIMCPGCGYTARTTAKWLEHGLPVCPCGETMQS